MDIKAYIRGLDREEEELRMQIMRIQVRIQQLHDARMLMMHRAEEHAAAANQPSPFGMLNGAEIVLRDPTLMLAASEAGRLSHAAKTGEPPAAITDATAPRKKAKPVEPSVTARIFELLKEGGPPMAAFQIAEALGLDAVGRKRMNGALNALKTRGQIDWDKKHRYFRVPGAVLRTRSEGVIAAKRERQMAGEPPKPRMAQGANREAVQKVIAKRGALTAGEIVKQVLGNRPYDKGERDKVYGVLHNIRNAKSGPMIYDGERYRMRQVEG